VRHPHQSVNTYRHDAKDLIYEGIATDIDAHLCYAPAGPDAKDLIYEGIATTKGHINLGLSSDKTPKT